MAVWAIFFDRRFWKTGNNYLWVGHICSLIMKINNTLIKGRMGGFVLVLIILCTIAVLPAAAINVVPPGGTVFRGEEGLNISATGVSAHTTLGWFAPGSDPTSRPPDEAVVVADPDRFYVDPGMRLGSWYRNPGTQDATVAFIVNDPHIDIQIRKGTEVVNGMSVLQGDLINFRIITNLDALAQRHGNLGAPSRILVTDPNGVVHSALLNQANVMVDLSAGQDPSYNPNTLINTNPFLVSGGEAVWDTGHAIYPPGEYSIRAECVANRMNDNYNVIGKTVSQAYSLTVLPGPGLEFRLFINGEYQSLDTISMAPGQEQRLGLFLRIPEGLAGYNLTVKLSNPASNPGAAYFKNGSIEFPDWAKLDNVGYLGAAPYTQVFCTATDLDRVTPIDDAFLLFDITIIANGTIANGTGTAYLDIDRTNTRAIHDRIGNITPPIYPNRLRINISGPLPFPNPKGGFFNEPYGPKHGFTPKKVHIMGPDLYYDLDGNDVIGFNDVVLFYQYMEKINNGGFGNKLFFDYDMNGWIGFNDLIHLYNNIEV